MGPGLLSGAPRDLTGSALANVTALAVSSSEWTPRLGEGLLIGEFKLADGRQALLLHNQNFDFTIWPTLEFHDKVSEVLEVDPETGVEAALLDDSPLMAGLQVRFSLFFCDFQWKNACSPVHFNKK